MPRNLNDRVVLMVSIQDPVLRDRVKPMVFTETEDNQKAHVMQSDGTWKKEIDAENPINSQEIFQEMAEKRDQKGSMTLRQRLEPYDPVQS